MKGAIESLFDSDGNLDSLSNEWESIERRGGGGRRGFAAEVESLSPS